MSGVWFYRSGSLNTHAREIKKEERNESLNAYEYYYMLAVRAVR